MAPLTAINKTLLHNNRPLSVLHTVLFDKTLVTVNELLTGESV